MESPLLSFIPFFKGNDENFSQFKSISKSSGVESIKQINCFIGSNNSGKSRLIRNLFASLKYKPINNVVNFESFNDAYHGDKWNSIFVIHYLKQDKRLASFHEAINYLLDESNYHSESQNHTLYYHVNQLQEQKKTIQANLYNLLLPYYSVLQSSYSSGKINIKNWTNIRLTISPPIHINNQSHIDDLLSRLNLEIDDLSNSVYNFLFKNFNLPKLYIPTLRGMRTFGHDSYAQRTEKDYSIPQNRIFTGLSIYDDLKKHLLGSFDKRELVRNFEIFLSESFFKHKDVSLIPVINSDVVHIRVGEKEHPIYDLGDGVQALILLTFPLFLRKDKEHAIFIEEPETHLHPKWQRFFLDTIREYFHKHQFFFTTHSNVLMNWQDSNIYYIKQDSNSDKTLVQHIDTQHSEILEDLGYQASDLLNANYIVWVEGISDKIYLKQFIKACDNSLVEGIHYTIMMYGGCAQLRHFAIEEEESYKIRIDNMSKNFGFCIDSDNNKGRGFSLEKEKKKFQKACKEAEKFCWVTTVRETENLIPLDIWKEAAITYAKAIKHHTNKTITLANVSYLEDDIHGDRMRTKVKVTSSNSITVNDKIKMAQQVIKIFPQNETDLQRTPELFKNVNKLVSQIKEKNLM